MEGSAYSLFVSNAALIRLNTFNCFAVAAGMCKVFFYLHVTPSLSFRYICFRKSEISFGFFPGNGISSAAASLNWLFNMALKTGECILSIWRWT